MSNTQIGIITSVSTAFVIFAQMFWGTTSDRAKSKNTVLLILYGCAACIGLLYYLGTGFWFLITIVTLFAVFFNPIIPLQDNLMLETLEKSRWNYGQVRIGGTVGYCVAVLVIGNLLDGRYSMIFWMVALALGLCILVSLRLPKVKGHRSAQQAKTPYRALLKYKTLMGIILFNLAFSFGVNLFYTYYSIYLEELTGNGAFVGTMLFACAVAEIPMLFIVNRLVRRFGTGPVLIISGLATCLRWFLLFVLVNPYLIVAANLLHGVGYTGFSYCIISFINKTVPKDIRATSQTFNALVGSIFSKFVFGFLGGVASDFFSIKYLMLVAGIVMAAATVWFFFWSRKQPELQKG